MKRLLPFLFSFLLISASNAQWIQLTSPALSSVEYSSIVFTGTSVIAVNEGGVYRSADNGLTWNISVSGIDTSQLSVTDITYIQSRSEVWISSSCIYKSTDDGITWTKMNLTGLLPGGWSDNLSHIGSRLIITYNEWDPDLMTNTNKLCYSDNGINWSYGSTLSLDNSSWWSFIKDDNDKTVYMIESPNDNSAEKLWYTTNATSKQLHPVTGLGSDPDMNYRSFSIDPQGNNLFFRDEGAGKYYFYDSITLTWSERMNGIGGAGLTIGQVFDIHSLGDHVLAPVLLANASSEIFIKLYYSDDNAENWVEVTNPGVNFPIFENQMIIAGSNRIIGSYFNSKIAYSDNIGQTWNIVNTLYSGEFKSLVTLSSGNIFTVSLDQEQGMIKSTDNGDNWSQHNGDLPTFSGIYFVDNLFPGSGNILYVIAQEDPFTEIQYLFTSTDEGENYTKLTTTPVAERISFVGRHGSYPILFFSDNNGNGTYQYTDDAGTTWYNISAGIAPLLLERVQGIKGNGTMMFLFGEKSGKTRVYLSLNNGVSFSDITYELDVPNLQILVSNNWDWRTLPSAVSSFRADGVEFYLAVKDNSTLPREVCFYKLNSTQDGWVKAGSNGIDFSVDVDWHSLRNIGGVWYFTTATGVFASIDNCNSWLRVWDNEGFLKGVKPASIMVNNFGIFMGTYGTGLWRAQLTQPVFATLPVEGITDVQAEGGATLTSTGGLPFGNKGFCWAEHTVPTTSDNTVFVGNKWESFTGILGPLTASTTYYVRSFIQSPKGLTYGNEETFTSSTISSVEPETSTNLLVYPNPVSDILNIKTGKAYSMQLMDITGRVVLEEQLFPGTSSLMLKKLPAGLYFLKLTGGIGEVRTVRILVN